MRDKMASTAKLTDIEDKNQPHRENDNIQQEFLCGVDPAVCPQCSRATLRWKTVDARCAAIVSVDITNSSCTTSVVPFDTYAKICIGDHHPAMAHMKARRQELCGEEVANDTRIFIEKETGTVKTALTATGVFSVSVDTEVFGCAAVSFSLEDGKLSPLPLVYTDGAFE